MITRNAKTIYDKPRKGGKSKGFAPFKFHHKFDQILLQVEAYFAHEIDKKSKPTWHNSAKDTIPHLLWSYTNSNFNPGKNRIEQGEYENAFLYLCLCTT